MIMNKSMYSLMLMDEVVKKVDEYAYLHNTNRSNIINQILAEYLNVQTPEMISKEIFRLIEEFIDYPTFKVQQGSNYSTLAIKSSLAYKYRPTINYSIELFRDFTGVIGELTVTFRTQSSQFLQELANFFDIWMRIERNCLDCELEYSSNVGRFIRAVKIPDENYSNQDISQEISNYILLFDKIIKKYLAGNYSDIQSMTNDYQKLREHYNLTI